MLEILSSFFFLAVKMTKHISQIKKEARNKTVSIAIIFHEETVYTQNSQRIKNRLDH